MDLDQMVLSTLGSFLGIAAIGIPASVTTAELHIVVPSDAGA
jgi:hypothetical protein